MLLVKIEVPKLVNYGRLDYKSIRCLVDRLNMQNIYHLLINVNLLNFLIFD